jgi:hypothetical protein
MAVKGALFCLLLVVLQVVQAFAQFSAYRTDRHAGHLLASVFSLAAALWCLHRAIGIIRDERRHRAWMRQRGWL